MNTCISGMPISDRELLAYLDGEPLPSIAGHLAVCPACASRAQTLRATETRLSQTLRRVDCPSAQTVADYRQGFLAADEHLAVASHLAFCPHCAAELARLDYFLAEIDPLFETDLGTSVRTLVARLVTWGKDAAASLTTPLSPGLAYGAVRGVDNPTRVYQAEDYQIILDIATDLTRPGRYCLQGLVTHLDGTIEASLATAHLTRQGQPAVTTRTDELGGFTFGLLLPGVYDLTLSGPGLDIRVEEISL